MYCRKGGVGMLPSLQTLSINADKHSSDDRGSVDLFVDPFVDPSLRLRPPLPPSNVQEVNVPAPVFGEKTPGLYKKLTDELVKLGKWIELMSAGVEILTPFNTGYKEQKMLMVRYYPHRVKSEQVPDQSILPLLAMSHVTSFDQFFSTVFALVERVQNLIANLQEAKFRSTRTDDDGHLKAVVNQADENKIQNLSSLRTAVAFYQCVENSVGRVVYPTSIIDERGAIQSVQVQNMPQAVFKQKVMENLQTSFIEAAMKYFSGTGTTGDDEDNSDPTLTFTYTANDEQSTLYGLEALKGRFDRRARKYWNPFSTKHGRRGIEVINPDDLFEAPMLRQSRISVGVPHSFVVELAARALFETVHTTNYQSYTDRSELSDLKFQWSDSQKEPTDKWYKSHFNVQRDGCGKGLPVEYNLIKVLDDINTLEQRTLDPFRFKYTTGPLTPYYTEYGLFPKTYSDGATTLYNRMQQSAKHGHRYTGLLREDPNVMMQFLDEDLHPSKAEGTLKHAEDDFEKDMVVADEDDEDGDDGEDYPGPSDLGPDPYDLGLDYEQDLDYKDDEVDQDDEDDEDDDGGADMAVGAAYA